MNVIPYGPIIDQRILMTIDISQTAERSKVDLRIAIAKLGALRVFNEPIGGLANFFYESNDR